MLEEPVRRKRVGAEEPVLDEEGHQERRTRNSIRRSFSGKPGREAMRQQLRRGGVSGEIDSWRICTGGDVTMVSAGLGGLYGDTADETATSRTQLATVVGVMGVL